MADPTAEKNNNDNWLVWVDIETFGLSIQDPILEVEFRITDLDLKAVASVHELVWGPTYRGRIDKNPNDWAIQTHTKNGLLDAAAKFGHRIPFVDDVCFKYLGDTFKHLGIYKPPLTGSSVHFDRGHLTQYLVATMDLFGHRLIDNSTTKELCRRYNPPVYAKMKSTLKPAERHRVGPDLNDSIEEFRFYRDNFIFDSRPDLDDDNTEV